MTARNLEIVEPAQGERQGRSYSIFEAPPETYRPAQVREVTLTGCPAELSDAAARQALEFALSQGYGTGLPVRWPHLTAWLARQGYSLTIDSKQPRQARETQP